MSNIVLYRTPNSQPEEDPMVVAHVMSDGSTRQITTARTTESKLGQAGWRRQAGNRLFSPEAANADIALLNPADYFKTAGGPVASVIPLEGECEIVQADYNVLENLQYMRDAASYISSVGRNDQRAYALTGGSSTGIWIFQAFSSPNVYLGFQVEWGLSLLQSAAFNLELMTEHFEGRMNQPVNRSFQLRMWPDSRRAGGMFSFLFASRISGTSAGYSYNGTGGMNLPIIQPAWLPDIDASVIDAPKVTVTVPTSVAPYVSFNFRPITAASPALANLRERTLEMASGI